MTIEEMLREARAVDWSDLTSVFQVGGNLLTGLGQRKHDIVRLIESFPELRVECFPNFFKVVLGTDKETGANLRLHYFPSVAPGSRHSHRWAFSGRVLVGCLRHTIFEEDVDYAEREPGQEQPILVRDELPGSTYALGPVNVHSILPLEPSLTIVLRGPQVRSIRFVDIPGGERGWSRRYENEEGAASRGEVADAATARKVVAEILDLLPRAERTMVA
jgi:hypothetical protein